MPQSEDKSDDDLIKDLFADIGLKDIHFSGTIKLGKPSHSAILSPAGNAVLMTIQILPNRFPSLTTLQKAGLVKPVLRKWE